jgi:hypothetical protein
MFRRVFAGAVLFCAAIVGSSAVARAAWVFTKIADTAGPYASISPFAQNLSINENGMVAFSASLDAGGSGIFKGSGGAVTTIHTVADTSLSSSPTSINDGGSVAFTRADSVYVGDGTGGSATALYTGASGYPAVAGVSINNSGALAFAANGTPHAIVTGNGGPLTVIADDAGAFSTFNSRPEINNAGQIAWSANYDNQATHETLFRNLGKAGTTIADSIGNVLAFIDEFTMNNLGTVAFGANTSTGSGIYRGDGASVITTIVDTAGPYSTFTDGNLRPKPGLNDNGAVALWAKLDTPSTVQGIFTGPNPATDAVIETGDPLFGTAKVTDLAFSGRGFNNAGQIAFVAVLDNGTTAVVRADFVPEPTGALLIAAAAGLARRRRR